jgi:DNA-binding transcriptional ArsR family regulator
MADVAVDKQHRHLIVTQHVYNSRHMENNLAIDCLSALAQPTRLEVFRLLVKQEPDGLPAGEIARRMDVPHNTMSTHLSILTRAGLVSVERHSRSMIYRVQLNTVRTLVLFLLRDCCNGQPDLCAPLLADLTTCCSTSGATCA